MNTGTLKPAHDSAHSPAWHEAVAHRPDIDGLRGIAILSVFAVHSVPDSLQGGFVGVDVFFVLSGYLISLITLKELTAGTFSIGGFYARRVRRLAPALLLVLSTCLLFSILLAYPKDSKDIAKHVAAGAASISNLALWQEAGYFDQSSKLKPLLHLWSLGIEEQFYIAWPLIAVGLFRFKRRALYVVMAAALVSFALNVAWVDVKPKGTFFLPPTRFWELLVGVSLAYWTHYAPSSASESLGRLIWPTGSSWRPRMPSIMSTVGVALLVLSLWSIKETDHFPGWWALLPTSATALLIAAGTRGWINRVLLVNPILSFYGRISYPLYLWHWPLLTFPLLLDEPQSALGVIVILCVSVALATATYYAVERPFRYGALRRKAPALLIGGMVVVGLAGWAIYRSDGLLHAYPPEVRSIAAVQINTDYDAYRIERCFLRSEQRPLDFADSCVDEAPRNSPLLMLWGDSHAAALYPGLKAQATTGSTVLRIGQFTAAACQPGLATSRSDNRHCDEVNSFVRGRILELRPSTVVLAANWGDRPGDRQAARNESAPSDLPETIDWLFSRNVRHVIVIGPLPHWPVTPPRLLLKAWREQRELPERSPLALTDEIIALDIAMERAVANSGARYLSPLRALCNARGCATSLRRGDHVHAISFDESHLTAAGSELLIERLKPIDTGPESSGHLRPRTP